MPMAASREESALSLHAEQVNGDFWKTERCVPEYLQAALRELRLIGSRQGCASSLKISNQRPDVRELLICTDSLCTCRRGAVWWVLSDDIGRFTGRFTFVFVLI